MVDAESDIQRRTQAVVLIEQALKGRELTVRAREIESAEAGRNAAARMAESQVSHSQCSLQADKLANLKTVEP